MLELKIECEFSTILNIIGDSSFIEVKLILKDNNRLDYLVIGRKTLK